MLCFDDESGHFDEFSALQNRVFLCEFCISFVKPNEII